MRARLINEIKRDGERSSLGSIGIGSVAKYKAYYALVKADPRCEKRLNQFKWYFEERQVPERKMVAKILETLDSTAENVLWFAEWMEIGYNSKVDSAAFLDKLLEGEKFEVVSFDKTEQDEMRKKLDEDPEVEDYYYDYNAVFYPDYNVISLTYTNSALNTTRDGYIIAKPNITKERVNEIKRGEGSPLGSIGVGHSATLKAYNYIKQAWPERMVESKLMSDVFKKEHHKFFKRAEQKLNISKEDYIWIEKNPALVGNSKSLETWVESLKWDKIISINPHNWDKFNSRVVKYNFEWSIGCAYASDGIFDKNRLSGYFVRNK